MAALLITTTLLSAFLVDESGAGDLNRDQDSADWVLHVFDARQGLLLNLGVAAASVCRTTLGPPFVVCTPVAPVVGRAGLAFLVGEAAQGSTDLNGDGDAGDDVLHVYSVDTDAIINTRLAVARDVGRDVSSYTYPVMPVIVGDGIAFLVGEAEQGGTDLNLDGDAVDDVLHVIEPRSHQIVNFELAAATVLGPFGARNAIWPQLDHHHVTFIAGEDEQGGVDLNGDGDTDDDVTYKLQMQSGRLRLAPQHEDAKAGDNTFNATSPHAARYLHLCIRHNHHTSPIPADRDRPVAAVALYGG